MKKSFLLVAIVFLLSGCGNKIKCVYSDKETHINSEVVGHFKKGYLDSLDFKSVQIFDSSYEFELACKAAKEAKIDNIKVECKNKEINISYSSKGSKDVKVTKEEFKKSYAKYTCK